MRNDPKNKPIYTVGDEAKKKLVDTSGYPFRNPAQEIVLKVRPDDFYECFFLHILARDTLGPGKYQAKIEWEEWEPNEYVRWHSDLILSKEMLQTLMTSMWDAGIRPNNGVDVDTIKALNKHIDYLEDLNRKLLVQLFEKPPLTYLPSAILGTTEEKEGK